MSFILKLLGLSSPTSLGIYAAVILGLAVGSFTLGWHEKSLRDDAALVEAYQLVNLETIQADKISLEVGQTVETATVAISNFTTILIQKVPEYVTQKADAQCTLTAGFADVLDAAAGLSALPDAASGAVDSAIGTPAHAAAANIAANYAICRDAAERLKGWQDWYAKQQALAAKRP
jgi:hypothetical protein